MASGENKLTTQSSSAVDLGRFQTAICVTASLISSQKSNDVENKGDES